MRSHYGTLIVILLIGVSGSHNPLSADKSGSKAQVGFQLRNLITFTNTRVNDTLYPVSVNNWWGYMNQRGNLVIFPQYDWTDDFHDGLARAVIDGGTGFIKGNGNWVHTPNFVYADRYAGGLAVVGDGEHFGYIDKSGKPLTPIQLDGALRFREGRAGVMKDGLCGFINRAGDLVVPLRYKQVRSFHEGYAAFRRSDPDGGPNVQGYINPRGREVFVDKLGEVEALGDFNDGLARIKGGGKWGYLGKNWKIRIKVRFDDARDFTNGVAAVRIGQKWGFIDKSGRLVIKPVYADADDMDDPLAMVTLDGKVGYINRAANQGVTPQFSAGQPYFRNYARVDLEPSFAYIDRTGTLIWDPRMALEGFINTRNSENVAIATVEDITHHRTLDPPAYREPIDASYPPDYLYEEVLPSPSE